MPALNLGTVGAHKRATAPTVMTPECQGPNITNQAEERRKKEIAIERKIQRAIEKI